MLFAALLPNSVHHPPLKKKNNNPVMGKLLWVSSSNQVSNFSRATLASSTLDIFT